MARTPTQPALKQTPVLVQASLKRLASRLTLARKLREMTQEQLAALSDVSLSTLRALEDGADGVSIGNVMKVMSGLNLLDQFDLLLDPKQDPQAVAFAEGKARGR